ncbi:FixH family protein [Paenisporosarcina indica]|uniref:FixH family protein n=1 Tax=Paenisporosarcina indica TaxID=650093 RepID=UPI00094FAFA5|nr:FixH family protein [Paenisporosarcina indica]
MKRFLAVGSILVALILSACGENEVPKSTTAEVPEIIEVELTVPETATVGKEVPFTAVVTQGDELVDDANEVKFEVLNITSGEKELVEASLNKDKHYTIMYTFETNGKYDITSHVTARDMHTMPTKQVTVTGGEEATVTPEEPSHGDDHHHSNGATIEFADGTATVGESVNLLANVSLSDVPLEGARVRYDISLSPEAKHTWLEVPEKEPGVYEIEYAFTAPGTYEIEVHVTKGDDIHDHVIKTYTVK